MIAPRFAVAQDLRLQIAQPAAGAVVDAAAVPVVLAVEGADLPAGASVWPHAGEFHIALDGVDVLQTTELRFTLMAIPPGAHRLRATLEGYAPAPLASEEVAFTAQNIAPGAGASWYLAGAVAAVGAIMFGALVLLWLIWVRPHRVEPLDQAPEDPASDDGRRTTDDGPLTTDAGPLTTEHETRTMDG